MNPRTDNWLTVSPCCFQSPGPEISLYLSSLVYFLGPPRTPWLITVLKLLTRYFDSRWLYWHSGMAVQIVSPQQNILAFAVQLGNREALKETTVYLCPVSSTRPLLSSFLCNSPWAQDPLPFSVKNVLSHLAFFTSAEVNLLLAITSLTMQHVPS